jgi:hypothetical protein
MSQQELTIQLRLIPLVGMLVLWYQRRHTSCFLLPTCYTQLLSFGLGIVHLPYQLSYILSEAAIWHRGRGIATYGKRCMNARFFAYEDDEAPPLCAVFSEI